ncbi:MAG: hypothetical protein KJO42_03270 [Silicimonas sp.]|nr:hypothetical protein [Silicimonas sp.]
MRRGRFRVGAPIAPHEIEARSRDPKAMMDILLRRTYALSPTPLEPDFAFEFGAKHRRVGADGGRDI